MFTRARLHLTLLYAALLGVTVALVAGAIGVLAVQEARSTDDRELQIRAASMAAHIPPGPPPVASGPPPPGFVGPRPHLEEEGLLEYLLPVRDGQILTPPFNQGQGLTGLPDLSAAQETMRSRRGRYDTISVSGNQIRLYSLAVVRDGRTDAVVQVARSRYFVNAAITDLALIALAAGLIGLVLSGAAGYWLAGRTLRPIAEALGRQRNFAADASHELRTPLTVILTNAELLLLHPERRLADYHDVVTDIVDEIRRLARLVADLLTLARADQGTAVLVHEPVDLPELAQTVVRQYAPAAAAKGLELKSDIEAGVLVTGDRDRLQQLAVILIDNAIRYTAKGSVTVRVAQHGHEALLSVSDTGAGIAPEHLPHVFERFYRTDSARSSEDGGSGLGLALAQWIVQSHRGRIEAVSTVGRGSTFAVHLHAARRSEGGASGEQPLETASVQSGGRETRV